MEFISTHTPLAGRDIAYAEIIRDNADFYSHAPRGARRQADGHAVGVDRFLLTRPSRGATSRKIPSQREAQFLLTRPSRGATHLPSPFLKIF